MKHIKMYKDEEYNNDLIQQITFAEFSRFIIEHKKMDFTESEKEFFKKLGYNSTIEVNYITEVEDVILKKTEDKLSCLGNATNLNIRKYEDEWYIVAKNLNINFLYYLCDTLEGVKQCIK